MPLPSPCWRFLWLVGEGCQGKPAVGEAHSLCIILQHLISSFYDLPLVLGVCRLADGVYPVVDDQLVHLSHEMSVTSVVHGSTLECGGASYSKSIYFSVY